MLEGTRAFDMTWGALTGGLCFAIGIAMIAMWVRARGGADESLFGARVDPGRGLHLGWAAMALAMGGTNVGCRFIDHHVLAGVHEGFFALTLVVYAVLLPRLIARVRSRTIAARPLA
ncbi:MAG: hypothetical protein NVS2B8_04110 [Vulcanimicrobiaceae bacterium]